MTPLQAAFAQLSDGHTTASLTSAALLLSSGTGSLGDVESAELLSTSRMDANEIVKLRLGAAHPATAAAKLWTV